MLYGLNIRPILFTEAAIDWLDRQSGETNLSSVFHLHITSCRIGTAGRFSSKLLSRTVGETRVFNGSYGGRYNPVTHTHAQFAAMIARLDNYVGEILKKLKEKGLDENTIVIFFIG